MRTLVGFALGYYIGTRAGPERIAKLARDIADSPEFRAVRSNLETVARQMLDELQQNVDRAHGFDPIPDGDARKAVSGSEALRDLLATGAGLFEAVLARFTAPNPERGNATQQSE